MFLELSLSNYNSFLRDYLRAPKLSCDTETTGLEIHKEDHLFCAVVSNGDTVFYVSRENLHLLKPLFDRKDVLWFFHNAKFDLHAISREGFEIEGEIHDCQVVARLLSNDELKYSLEACVERAKLPATKGDLKQYCIEHGYYENIKIPGKKKKEKRYFFNKVPRNLVFEYACTDALVTFMLGNYQLGEMSYADKTRRVGTEPMRTVYEMEKRITKILYKMEKRGIQLDVEYTKKSLEIETKKYESAASRFKELTGVDLVDSEKCLKPIFDKEGLKYGVTEKGSPSFDNKTLKSQDSNEIVKCILEYRDAYKVANSYYSSFLYYADKNGVIHANFKQSGTITGRFSVTEPALQTLKKDDSDPDDELDQETKSQVRRCFIARPGFKLFSIDFKAQEYRVMLDYSEQMDLIKQVIDGMDVHQATANMINQSRKKAKSINFGLLYGQGKETLAQSLNMSVEEATELKNMYFRRLPKIREFVNGVKSRGERTGVIYNRYGRRYILKDRRFAYKLPNYVIQGSCSDHTRASMISTDLLFKDTQSYIAVQVHDELLFELAEGDFYLLEDIKQAMIKAFPSKHLPMEVDVEYGDNWQELSPL